MIIPFVIFIIGPVGLWFLLLRFKLGSDMLSLKNTTIAFGLGAVATYISLFPENLILGFLDGLFGITVFTLVTTNSVLNILKFISVAVVEEGLKLAVLYYGFLRHEENKNILRGIFYGTVVALGFSFMENIFYFNSAYETLSFRAIFTTLMHLMATGIMGYYACRTSLIKPKINPLLQGFILAVSVHALFNFLLAQEFHLWIILLLPFILKKFSLTLKEAGLKNNAFLKN